MKLHAFIILLAFAAVQVGCAKAPRRASFLPEARSLGRTYATNPPAARPTQRDLTYRAVQEPTGPLTLRKALALALLNNPELIASGWEIRAAEARRLQAALLPNPKITASGENLGGDLNGTGDAETTIELSQLIELGGKRAARRRVAGLEAQLAGWDYEALRLTVFTNVVKVFVDVLGGQLRRGLAAETARIAEEVAATVEAQVEAGAVSSIEAQRTQIAASLAAIELQRAERDLTAARATLAALWGSTRPAFSRAVGVLVGNITPPPLQELLELLSENPDLARWSQELARRRAGLLSARSRAIPDLTLSGGFRRLGETEQKTFVAGLSFSLPLFDRNQGGRREALALLAKATAGRRAVETRLHAALTQAHTELETAAREVRLLATQALPQAKDVFDAVREGYRRGKLGYLNLSDAQRIFAETRLRNIEALVALHQAKADVERLIGMPISEVPSRSHRE